MAQYVAYASFVCYFADPAEYNFAIGLNGSNVVEMSPATAASLFGFVEGVNYNTGGAINPVKGMYGFAPYGIPTFPGPGVEVGHPSPSGRFLKSDIDSVLVPGQGAPSFPNGPDLLLKWSATIQQVFTGPSPEAQDIAPVPLRRWMVGFEFNAAEGGQGGANFKSRDASRTLEGIGWSLTNIVNTNLLKTLNEYFPALTARDSWERFYVRVRRFGSIDYDIWRSHGLPSNECGARIKISPTGDLKVYNILSTGVEVLQQTTAGCFIQDAWTTIDLLIKYNPVTLFPNGSGSFRVYINHSLAASFTVSATTGGLGVNNGFHVNSLLGTELAAVNTWKVDFDDWHNAEIPTLFDGVDFVESLTNVDWLIGTHIQALRVDTGTHTNWTGPLQAMNQMITLPQFSVASARLVSTTSGAAILGVTEANDDFQRATGIVLSQAAALVSMWSVIASGTTGGTLGYSVAGGGVVSTSIAENSSGRANSYLYPGTGTEIVPASITPFIVAHGKAATSVSASVAGLQASIQYIGVWGLEDDPTGTYDLPRVNIGHNAYWPTIAAAFLGPVPDGPIAIQSGTYVGNGTEQSVIVAMPFHFLWIRNVTSPTAIGTKWYGSNLAAHPGCSGKAASDYIQRVDFDPDTGQASFTIAGNNVDNNQSGHTYQYIAFCDPTFQYLLCGSFLEVAGTSSAPQTFISPSFTPVCGFFVFDRLDNDFTTRLIYKGPGMGANAGLVVNGSAVADCATLGTGGFTSLSGIHNQNNNQTAYALFQTGNQCSTVMVQAFTYTGDGTGTRVITCTPASGRFPCFVYVQPSNGTGYVKDPSDITTASRQIIAGSASASAIMACGNDTITVGSTLNANGIVYSVFIFPGSTSSFSNGLFQPGSCLPSWIDDFVPEPPIGINILPEGGLILSGNTPKTLLLDVSGIYTIVPGKTNDTLYDRLTGQPNVDVAIPNPNFKTGYLGG